MGPENRNSSGSQGPGRDLDVLHAAKHNVITFDELRDLGLTADEIQYRVEVGRLHRKYTEVFAVGRPDLTLDGVFLAAVRACGPKAKLGHLSALREYELTRRGTYRIDVIAPRSIKPKNGIRLHRPRCLDVLDTTVVDGIPITSVARRCWTWRSRATG